MNDLSLYYREPYIGRNLKSDANLTKDQREHVWLVATGRATPHELMTALLHPLLIPPPYRQRSSVLLALKISDQMKSYTHVTASDAIQVCKSVSQNDNIGVPPHPDDWIEDERQGLTNRNTYTKWLKNFADAVLIDSQTHELSTVKIHQADHVSASDGTKAYFGEPCGDKQHYWFSESPHNVKSELESKFGTTVSIQDIKLIVDAPAPENWKQMITPARLFISTEDRSTPYPFPVELKGDKLTGKVAQMFPEDYCMSTFMEYNDTYLRVFSWCRGQKNNSASNFFKRDFLGPMVLVVPV